MNESDLENYQRRCVDFILNTPRCAVWAFMSAGKTICTLTALQYLLDSEEIKKILVISTGRVIKDVWPAEIEKWSHIKMQATVVAGTPTKRIILAKEKTQLHTLSVDLVEWAVKNNIFNGYDCVVLDESTLFKSWASARFKKIRQVIFKIKRVIELTGTPCSNTFLNLWAQIYLLDRGQRLGATVTGFKRKYFYSDYNEYNWWPKEETEKQLTERLKDIVFVLSNDENKKLPAVKYNDVLVTLNKSTYDFYETAKKHAVLELENEPAIIANSAVKVSKLLQITGGVVYAEEEPENEDAPKNKKIIELNDKNKINALHEIIENSGSNVIIVYNYQHHRDAIKKEFPHAVIFSENKTALKDWNDKKIKILLLSPKSAAHGLNLQFGGDVIIWFTLPHSRELYDQTNARIIRTGAGAHVVIHRLIARNTVDTDVVDLLNERFKSQKEFITKVLALSQ